MIQETVRHIVWQPQPGPQTALVTCPVTEVFFGGARGGGKTDSSLGDWLNHSSMYGENAIGVFFRRKFKQLEEVIARAKTLFKPLGAKYNESKAEFTMPNGARLKFRYLERDSDAEEYQGHAYTRVYIEEATNFPSPDPINKLRATLRSGAGVPCGMRLTGNPGGPGHHWVKERYITPNPRGYEVFWEEFTNPFTGKTVKIDRVFIPSKLSDNKLLLDGDSTYVARLHQSGSAELVKAWLTGDWDAVDGVFFNNFRRERHVLPMAYDLKIPVGAVRFRAMDWGSAKPFSIGWYAISDGTWGLPHGALFKYHEWYGMEPGKPNVGLRMNADQVAKGIRNREIEQMIRVKYGTADPSIFKQDGGPSIAEMMLIAGVSWGKADNARMAGWQQMRWRLDGELGLDGLPIGDPMLYFSEGCEDTIRTIESVQSDEKNPEDLDTDQEDHALDETRYGCMSRPWIPRIRVPEEMKVVRGVTQMKFEDMLAALRKNKERQNG